MMVLRDFYRCEICGNVVQVANEGAPVLVCCGQPMKKLEAKTEDSSVEKHVPYVEVFGDGIKVKIGRNQAHPMLENHYIKFIEVHTANMVMRHELKPGDAPEATFPVKKDDVVEVLEWCNLHGLWKA